MTTEPYPFPTADTPADVLAARNAWFAGLTPAAQRVELAREVVRMLDAEVLEARIGWYGRFKDLGKSENEASQENLLGITCEACARGSLLLARVRGFDEITVPLRHVVGTEWTGESTTTGLEGIFSRQTLAEMEAAFELTIYDDDFEGVDMGRIYAACRMFSSFTNDTFRLRAICANLIANGGEFVIPGGAL